MGNGLMYTVQGLGQAADITCVTRVREQIVREQLGDTGVPEVSWLPLLLLGLGLYTL